MKNTVLDDVKGRMKELQEKRAAELDTIREKQSEARERLEEASKAMHDATEQMDVDAFTAAKEAKKKWQTAMDMYSGRFQQIKQQELVTEADSDAVIDSLLTYEEQLDAAFKEKLFASAAELQETLEQYRAAVNDTENTIRRWCQDIHANYSTRGRTSRRDPITGEVTDRAEHPVPVRFTPYVGCQEATTLRTYLLQIGAIRE